ncbi:bublin coiled-coil protein-like isoform X2 [Daphnia carinata]|uniref:bublin coiled-coil protein-like isoform X2 n=1 Tax=Daphnia carinata TaxID=120202 RepID=UPI00257D7809|nr:bublin coiled-coil protein-like isoform X2 [Daphnia carinata]
MVRNMNFNDPDKANGEELSVNEDEQHNSVASGEDDVMMGSPNMDENYENEICDESEETDPEYSSLDKQLDDLNSVLDVLEQKNDHIQSQLKALLETSREIRQNIVNEREADSSSDLATD